MSLVVIKGLPMLKTKPLKKGSFMKKSLKVLIASSALALIGSVLIGCGSKEKMIPESEIHEHTFSDDWSANDGAHWHAATCEHKSVMSGVEDHKFGAWNVDKPATEAAAGEKSRKCTVCDYVQKAEIAPLAHEHVFDLTKFESDDDNHWHKATCHEDIITGVEPHTYGNWRETVPATENTEGVKERECSVCHHVEQAKVDKTAHVHTYASEWSYNKASHWKAATCEHADSFKDFDAHQFGEWIIDNPSTETVAGSRHRECSVCHFVDTEDLPLAEHTHKFSNDWSKDALYHWHAATCGHEVVKDKAEHSFGAWINDTPSTETQKGTKHRLCDVCGYREDGEQELAEHVHTYDSEWTKDAEYHWHAANCGHIAIKDKAAHTPNRDYAIINQDVHCSICGQVMQPAGCDSNQYVPNDYVNVASNSANWYLFKLGSRTQIRINFTYDAVEASKILITVCRKSGSYYYNISNFYLAASATGGTYPLVTSTSYEEGVYYLGITNLDSSEHTIMPYHFSYTFTKTLKATKTFSIAGENLTYKMYEYVPQYNVDDSQKYVTIENADGEEVGFFQSLSMSQLSHFDSNRFATSFSFRRADGSSRTIYLPGQIYRSEQLPDGLYGFRGHDDAGKVYAGFKTIDSLKTLLLDDPYFKQYNSNVNELDATLWSWYAYDYVIWTPSAYLWDDANSKYVPNSSVYDIFGLFDIDWDEVCEPMTYDSTTEEFIFVNPRGGYNSMKITNTTDYNYSLFNLYQSVNAYNNNTDASSGYYAVMCYYIFDENGYRVNDCRTYSAAKTSSCWVADNYGWFYNTTNDKAHRFEIKPGETYYIVDYSYSGAGVTKTISQTTYTLTLNANFGDDPEVLTYLDGSLHAGSKYQKTYSANDMADFLLDNVDAPEGKEFAGWAGTKTGNVMFRASPYSSFNTTPRQVNKMDGTLYAKWIDAKDLIMTTRQCKSYDFPGDGSIKYFLNDIVDDSLAIHAGDSVNCYYANGRLVENMITEVGFGSTPCSEISVSDMADYPDEDPYIVVKYYNGIGGVHSQDGGFLGIYMEQEFDLYVCDEDADMICDLGTVNKGEAATLPFYGDLCEFDEDVSNWEDYDDLFGAGGYYEGKYFAGWSENGTDIVALDGGEYEPVKDTALIPIYKDVEDSGVVALRYGISFKTVGGNEYVRLTILDPNLTISTSTAFKLVMSDGTEIDIGLDAIKTDAGVALSSATSANGVILLKLFDDSRLADVADCIQIIVA